MKKSIISVVMVICLSLGFVFGGSNYAAKADGGLEEGFYFILSGQDPEYGLDVYNFGTTNGTKVQMYKIKTGEPGYYCNQLFYIQRRSDGYYTIRCSYTTDLYLHIKDENDPSSVIHTWLDKNNYNCHWNIVTVPGEDGYWYIQNRGNSSVMDNANGRCENENAIISYPFHGGQNQKFRLVKVDINSIPKGCLETAEVVDGKLHVKGYAFDYDNTGAALTTAVYLDGKWYTFTADKYRPDLMARFAVGSYHGFEEWLTVDAKGNQEVAVYTGNYGTNDGYLLDGCNKKVCLPDSTVRYYYKVNTSSGVNLRSGAGTGYKKLTAIPNNTVIEVLSISSNWAKVKYGSYTGYVCADYLKYHHEEEAVGGSSGNSAMMQYLEDAPGSEAKEYGGGSGTQCVELPKHYIDTVFGCNCHYLGLGNGNTLYLGIASQYPEKFTAIKYYEGFKPQVGDIISLYGSQKEYGHAAIVKSVSGNTYTIVEQWKNCGKVRERELTITGSSSSSNGIIGVARPK